jgi:hypothetical protein
MIGAPFGLIKYFGIFGLQFSFQIGATVCGRAFTAGDTDLGKKGGIFILTNPFEGDTYRAAFILHELS